MPARARHDDLNMPTGSAIAHDGDDHPVNLFAETWSLKFFTDRNENVELSEFHKGGAIRA